MTHTSKWLSFAAIGAIAFVTARPVVVRGETSENERIQKSVETLQELVKTPDDGIPEYILKRAEAIVVIPQLVKGGFVVGAEHGKGVMSIRTANGWSNPTFVQITGGSVGWQIGVQSTSLVLLVMNRDGVQDLLDSEFKIGADASVAAGPVGRSAEASTDAKMGAKILAYSRSKGLFAGLSLQGSALKDDKDANKDFYGHTMNAEQVFEMKDMKVPASVKAWDSALTTIARR